ncbi:MAG: hypothetical protein Q9204_002077 [Flavoplaca sp. TL-2023a]
MGNPTFKVVTLLNHAIKVLTSPRTDLHFSHPDRALPVLTHHTSLKYLTIVETASVPLYLVAGPSFDVWTDNESTEQWIHRCLLDDLKDGDTEHLNGWWARLGGQSKNSILLSVRGGDDAGEGSASEITEILLYAGTSQELNAPPTPPTSSPLEHGNHGSKTSLNVRIHALPLSSKIYNTLAQTPSIPHINPASDDQEFYYLPSPPPAQSHQHDDNPATKRPHIESLFDEATQIRRLHKKQGGEGIAKAMAAMDARMSMPALSSTTAALPELLINPNLKAQPQPRTPFSRASTTGCINQPPPPPPQMNPPSSRSPSTHLPPEPKRRRSLLARAPSLPSPSIDTERPASDVPDSTSAIEHQNKTTLSRIIMAGMRIHGLQPQHQRRKSIGGASDTQNPASPSIAGKGSSNGVNGAGGQGSVGGIAEDEYKAIYHQTFKSTTFAFRNTWKTSLIKEESLRDTANIFLSQFCTSPPNQPV